MAGINGWKVDFDVSFFRGRREMHAYECEGIVGGVLEDTFTRFNGGIFVHVVSGTVFGILGLQCHPMHYVAGYENGVYLKYGGGTRQHDAGYRGVRGVCVPTGRIGDGILVK